MFCDLRQGALSPTAQAAAGKLVYAVEALLSQSAENLFGEWCIADTDPATMLNRLILNGDPVPARLVEYAERQWNRPSVRQWVGQSRQSG